MRFFIFISIIMTAMPLKAERLSERQSLLDGLEHRYELRILALENRMDSLNVASACAQRLPHISASAGVFHHPYDSSRTIEPTSSQTYYRSGSGALSIITAESLSIAQQLPGGGNVSGNVIFDNQHFLHDVDSSRTSSAVALSYTQPLLRDAWRFGSVDYKIKVARLDNTMFTLGQKKELYLHCSDIRIRFWNLFETLSLVALYRREEAYARERMELERTRFSIGTASPLDTLNARLAYVNAIARLHNAQSDELQAREALAFSTGKPADEIDIDSTTPIACSHLPPPDELLRQIEAFDPQLRIFTVAAQRLELTQAQQRNSLLPRVDLHASWQRMLNENKASGAERFYGNAVIGLIASYAFPVTPRRIELSRTTASIQKNDLEQEQYREQMRLKVRELDRSWERERRAIEIASTAQQIAQQTLVASREGFTVGTVDRLSLDKAENDYRTACIELLEKQLLMKQLEITFDEMTGTTLSRFGVALQ